MCVYQWTLDCYFLLDVEWYSLLFLHLHCPESHPQICGHWYLSMKILIWCCEALKWCPLAYFHTLANVVRHHIHPMRSRWRQEAIRKSEVLSISPCIRQSASRHNPLPHHQSFLCHSDMTHESITQIFRRHQQTKSGVPFCMRNPSPLNYRLKGEGDPPFAKTRVILTSRRDFLIFHFQSLLVSPHPLMVISIVYTLAWFVWFSSVVVCDCSWFLFVCRCFPSP